MFDAILEHAEEVLGKEQVRKSTAPFSLAVLALLSAGVTNPTVDDIFQMREELRKDGI